MPEGNGATTLVTALRTRPRNTGPTTAVRTLVYARDGHQCVRCGTGSTLTIQHRTNRAMGGSSDPAINHPTNLVTACQACNMWMEANPAASYAAGWKVRRPTDPAHVPVRYPTGELRTLEPDGTSRTLGVPVVITTLARR
ncbi:HNH endonuclease [Streptomyces sp. MJM8645]|uniref:HNH endonuclease n=1 Tax=Streptomycetaceae TaxID=2062 RepID=UPI000A6E4CA1|nr:HNH endonuclease [Streptomyces sp. MJM8645]